MSAPLNDVAARLRDFRTPTRNHSRYDLCLEAAESQAARIAALEAERDKWSDAERDLSNAYVRLRIIIPGALHTPHCPSAEQVWDTTEKAVVALHGRAIAAEAALAKAREVLESIAGWRLVNIAGEFESGLRGIIRSIVDYAERAHELIRSMEKHDGP